MSNALDKTKRLLRWMGRWVPVWAAEKVARLFLTPAPQAGPSIWEGELAGGEPLLFQERGESLKGWKWGQGPRVLLVHGWGGNADSMRAFIRPLAEAGFEVLAFDGPAHGASRRSRTNVLEFSQFLQRLVDHFGPFTAAVGYSFGAASLLYALSQGMALNKLVLVAPFSDSDHNFDRFAELLELSDSLKTRARNRLLGFFGAHRDGWDLAKVVGSLELPVLLCHDREDREVPFAHSEALATQLPHGRLAAIEKVGHRKILRNREVISLAVDFLGSPVAAS